MSRIANVLKSDDVTSSLTDRRIGGRGNRPTTLGKWRFKVWVAPIKRI